MRHIPSLRVGGLTLLGLAVGGCMIGGRAEPGVAAEMTGPTLVTEITNTSDAELAVGYEYDAGNAGGGGEGAVGPCERLAQPWGTVAGTYTISVDEQVVFDGQVAAGMPATGYLIVRIFVDAEGRAEVTGPPFWSAVDREFDIRKLPGCGLPAAS